MENGDEEREDSGDGEAQEGAGAEALESELNTAVDKIYELRDIIRGLEAKLEARSQAEAGQSEVIRDLKVILASHWSIPLILFSHWSSWGWRRPC